MSIFGQNLAGVGVEMGEDMEDCGGVVWVRHCVSVEEFLFRIQGVQVLIFFDQS